MERERKKKKKKRGRAEKCVRTDLVRGRVNDHDGGHVGMLPRELVGNILPAQIQGVEERAMFLGGIRQEPIVLAHRQRQVRG